MNAQFLDEWVHTDTGKTITYTVSIPDGSDPDFTGATGIELHAKCRSPQRSFTLAGTLSSGPNRVFTFPSPMTQAAAPGVDQRDVYDFRVRWTLDAKIYWSSPGRLAVVRFP